MPVTKQNSSLSGERILGRSFMGRRRNFWIISEARREREKKKGRTAHEAPQYRSSARTSAEEDVSHLQALAWIAGEVLPSPKLSLLLLPHLIFSSQTLW